MKTFTDMTRFPLRAAAVLLLGLQLAHAADPAPRTFNIKAQTLAAALTEFARQSRQEILFAPEIVAQKRTEGVQGTLEPLSALSTLLRNTGLSFTTTPKGAILVSDRQQTSAARPTLQLVQANPAPAEDTEKEQDAAKRPAQQGDTEIMVTGKRIGIVNEGVIPRQENEAVRYNIIDRAAIDRSGATNLSDLLTRQIPQVANFGTDTQQIIGAQAGLLTGIQATGDTINLRGFGSGQTLILVNGRRLYGSESGGPDVSRIPLRAVERIEISPSSGSAIYGANAVGGVINIVLRKDFSGSEFGVYLGGAQGGAQETRLNLLQGMNFNNGATNLTVSAEYKDTGKLTLGDRGYHMRALERLPHAVVGDSVYLNEILVNFLGPRPNLYSLIPDGLGIPSQPSARLATVPEGFDGIGLTPELLNPTAGTVSLNTRRLDDAALVPATTSASVFATLEHALTDRVGVYSELSYRWADTSVGDFADYAPPMVIVPGHPLFPILNVPLIVATDAIDVPRARQQSEQNSYRVVAGVKGELDLFGGKEWRWSIDASWDRNETSAQTVRYTQLLALATFNRLYNPLRDLTNAPMLSQEQLDGLRTTIDLRGNPEVAATNWRANGDLFEMPGGLAALSFGAEYRHQYQASTQSFTYGTYATLPTGPGAGFNNFPDERRRSERDAYAAYMELRLPVLPTVDVSAAMRYEKYEDFQAATPPMLAVKWQALPDVAFRAQFSQGFQPPTQNQVSGLGGITPDSPFYVDSYTDPERPGLPNNPTVTLVSAAGNPDLKPETSDTWDAGVILTPRWIPGLIINASYFRYDKKDLAGILSMQEYVNQGYVVRGPNLPGDPVGATGPIVRIDMPYVNIASQFSDGWDFVADYGVGVGGGMVRFWGEATWTRAFYRQGFPGAPISDSLGYLGRASGAPIKMRARGGVSWERGEWAANWSTRYYGPFKLESNLPDAFVYDGPEAAATTEHDVQLRYRHDGLSGSKWLAGTQWILGVNNVFDRDPGYITDRGSLWYNYFSDPRQRYLYLDVRKSF